jgi:glyoxylase-like metal-dependent hydrolase (beta-lactamase superfamily II)
MREVADNVWMLRLQAGILNVYVVGDVLVDAGVPWSAGTILRHLAGREISAHAITHAHPDHMGASSSICDRLGIPFWVGERDVAVAEDPGLMAADFVPLPRTPISDVFMRATSGPGRRVDRALREGDAVDGFQVIETPGHTRGHISLWREADRVLIAGDAMWNLPRLTAPFALVNNDNHALRESIVKIAALEPAVACFGHGPVLTDPARIRRLADSL